MKQTTLTNRWNGISRRDSLRIGALTAFGLGLTDYLRCHVQASAPSAKAKRCVLIWLDGGPSHLETFDLKPQAPVEVRGPFAAISTKVPGIQLSELLPQTAKLVDHCAIIRSMTSPLGEHGIANQYLMTGYPPTPAIAYPSYGSVYAEMQAADAALPPYIAIPETRHGRAGFLGTRRDPFSVAGDPAQPNFRVRDLDFFPEVDETRLLRRREFLQTMDRAQAEIEQRAVGNDAAFEQAFRLVTSASAKEAFALDREPDAIRARYGTRTFGQSCLLARRLIEKGVPFVTITQTGWDTHESLELQLKLGYSGAKVGVGLIPTFDLGFSALLTDLTERGLLQETLVVVMGEFGRTPKLNPRGGRDHWPRVFSVLMAGGGVRGGQVIGESDRVGESPKDEPVTPRDLAYTLYSLLGIDPHHHLHTPDGRPIAINQGGKMIKGIV